jgi:hypothetical protein
MVSPEGSEFFKSGEWASAAVGVFTLALLFFFPELLGGFFNVHVSHFPANLVEREFGQAFVCENRSSEYR